ncbi:hypothetical protein JCM6882_008929 [Rhodosporidiobolus microsporus]
MPLNNTHGPSFSLCLLSSLPAPLDNPALPAPRVRFVARVVGLKLEDSLALVEDEGRVVLVELEQARRSAGAKWAPPRVKDRVMIWGEVVRSEAPLLIPSISAPLSSSPPALDPPLLVHAIRILDLGEPQGGGEALEGWREGVRGV